MGHYRLLVACKVLLFNQYILCPKMLNTRNDSAISTIKNCLKNDCLILLTLSFRSGSGKKGAAVKATPTPPLSAKSLNTKPKSSGRSKTKSQHSHEQHSNLSSPYAFSLNSTPPSGAKQGVSVGQSVLVVTIKDKTVKVHMPTDSAPRSPTLVECKAIIKHQQETNKQQEQEVIKIIISSHASRIT